MKPDKLQSTATSLDNVVAAYRALAGDQPILKFGGFEVDCAVPALVEHVILQAKSVCALARLSSAFAPAATASARSAMEVGALAAWLSNPSDVYEREGRFLGYFKLLERFNQKMASEMTTSDSEVSREISETITKYLKGMCAPRFGKAITPIPKPSMKAMMKDLGYEHLYPAYRVGCEIIHGGPETINRHRISHRSLEVPMGFKFGVFQDDHDWQIAFRITSWGVALSGYHSLRNSGFNNTNSAELLHAHKKLIAVVDKD